MVSMYSFGRLPDGHEVSLYTLTGGGVEVQVTNYGGIITSLKVPNAEGEVGDVVHGFASLDEYLSNHPYFGCVVGRFANRIAGGCFILDGVVHKLAQNDGINSLHGGVKGFDKVLWDAEVTGDSLKLSYLSPNGEEGYPGNLEADVIYTLSSRGEFSIEYRALTDKPTIVNLTNHTYFNLACGGDVLSHELTLDADYFTPMDSRLIPTGEVRCVAGTPMDFRYPTKIGARIDMRDEQLVNGKGYDCNWVVNGEAGRLRRIATLRDPSSGRVMVVSTTQPGIQFYTGNFLDGSLRGKGRIYSKRSGLCLETQHYPDAPNRRAFPSAVLRPGEVYQEKTVFRFHAG